MIEIWRLLWQKVLDKLWTFSKNWLKKQLQLLSKFTCTSCFFCGTNRWDCYIYPYLFNHFTPSHAITPLISLSEFLKIGTTKEGFHEVLRQKLERQVCRVGREQWTVQEYISLGQFLRYHKVLKTFVNLFWSW